MVLSVRCGVGFQDYLRLPLCVVLKAPLVELALYDLFLRAYSSQSFDHRCDLPIIAMHVRPTWVKPVYVRPAIFRLYVLKMLVFTQESSYLF